MKTRLQFRAQAGYAVLATLVELLVVIAIIGVLIDKVEPDAQKVQKAATRMTAYPRLAALATQLIQFSQAAQTNSHAFTLSLATDALPTRDPATADVNVDSLKFFCDADTKLTGLQNQVIGILATEGDSSEEHELLEKTKNALDGELPALQKLGQLLRSKVTSLCPSTIP
jgi:Tfp pilus assembly protein PilE